MKVRGSGARAQGCVGMWSRDGWHRACGQSLEAAHTTNLRPQLGSPDAPTYPFLVQMLRRPISPQRPCLGGRASCNSCCVHGLFMCSACVSISSSHSSAGWSCGLGLGHSIHLHSASCLFRVWPLLALVQGWSSGSQWGRHLQNPPGTPRASLMPSSRTRSRAMGAE